MKADLKNVTLVCVDTACHELTTLAIKECLDKCDFGDTLIFSDQELNTGIPTNYFSKDAGATDVWKFQWYSIPFIVKTSHFLIIQWDSWVVKPEKWTNDFLKYDYIGAPWNYQDGHDVGNGGFSLRSVQMARFIATNKDDYIYGEPEDVMICRVHRPKLEAEGFKWPSKHEAIDFSFEWYWQERNGHFGFHDPRNFPYVLPKDQLLKRIELMKENPFISAKRIIAQTEGVMAQLGDRCGYLSAV